MTLSESYDSIKGSIVGFAPHYFSTDEPEPEFPQIFGTGFVVREDGIIATNQHIVEYMLSDRVYKPPGIPPEDLACIAIIFKRVNDLWIHANLRVLSFALCSGFVVDGPYYGPDNPDVAFMQVNARGLPVVQFDDSTFLLEGLDIATAGYPLGTQLLTLPGYLHHATPTLRRGVISAVLPFPCERPHAFIIDIMSQGGASGSPVFFSDSGAVAGILYEGCDLSVPTSTQLPYNQDDPPHKHTVQVSTNITYAVPSRLILSLLNTPSVSKWHLPDDAEHVDAIIERQRVRATS